MRINASSAATAHSVLAVGSIVDILSTLAADCGNPEAVILDKVLYSKLFPSCKDVLQLMKGRDPSKCHVFSTTNEKM
jgi:hypothetical protein